MYFLKSTIGGFAQESTYFLMLLDITWVRELHEFIWSHSSKFIITY